MSKPHDHPTASVTTAAEQVRLVLTAKADALVNRSAQALEAILDPHFV